MPKITSARITAMPKTLFDPMPEVFVKVEGRYDEIRLFDYYPDEINFTPKDFIGLTVKEAHQLKFDRDKAYLQS